MSVERFDDRAEEYVRYRPTYPPEAIDAVLEGLGEPAGLVAADVGAGTGISARLLGDRGVRVYAVEPNAAMRERAEPHGRIEWCDGTAEATGLPDASVDLVLCAQAYHWFEPGAACREFGRILRPGGRLALMWNDGDETTPVARAYYEAVRAVATDATLSHKTVAAGPRVCPPFGEPRMLKFRHAQRLDADGLIGRAMSASYVPKQGEQAEWLRTRLREVHAEHAEDGVVSLLYNVWVYVADRCVVPAHATRYVPRPIPMNRIQTQTWLLAAGATLAYIASIFVLSTTWVVLLFFVLTYVIVIIGIRMHIRERAVCREVVEGGGLACPACTYPRRQEDDGMPCPECGRVFRMSEARRVWRDEGLVILEKQSRSVRDRRESAGCRPFAPQPPSPPEEQIGS